MFWTSSGFLLDDTLGTALWGTTTIYTLHNCIYLIFNSRSCKDEHYGEINNEWWEAVQMENETKNWNWYRWQPVKVIGKEISWVLGKFHVYECNFNYCYFDAKIRKALFLLKTKPWQTINLIKKYVFLATLLKCFSVLVSFLFPKEKWYEKKSSVFSCIYNSRLRLTECLLEDLGIAESSLSVPYS